MSTRKKVGDAKKDLLSQLLFSVKTCQSRFGGSRTELATEDDKLISQLCTAFEQVFLHGIKRPTSLSQSSKGIWQMTESLVGLRSAEVASFWPLIKSQLSKHEAERFLLLHNVRTDLGRGRAWLRAALNEHSLERYIHVILSEEKLADFYEESSFLLDDELSAILPQTAAGLGSILFALIVDNPELDKVNSEQMDSAEDPIAKSVPELAEVADEALDGNKPVDPDPLEQSGMKLHRKGKKKKKIPTAYISFDESESPASSVPSSSINTPTDKQFPLSAAPAVPPSPPRANMAMSKVIPPPPTVIPSSSPLQIPNSGPEVEKPSGNYSTSIKSSDNLSLYSDSSDRLDVENLSLSGILPSDRLKPVDSDGATTFLNFNFGRGGDPERAEDLIPVPSYTNRNGEEEDSTEFDFERRSGGSNSTTDSIFPTPTPTTTDHGHPEEKGNKGPRDQVQVTADEDRIRKLKTVLENELEMVTTLKAQLVDDRRQYNDQIKMLETRIETLTRENELLRHQLKKYIGAVQLLKDAGNGRRLSLDHDDDDDGASFEISPPDDQSADAADYERKLIQVAEMHGELMEFNVYLQALLQRKDHALRGLRAELEDLRGPLIEGVGGGLGLEEENLSMDLSYPSTEARNGQRQLPFGRPLRNNERVLINIWIPSAFLTGATNDLHHVYQVFLRIKDTEWNVYRRYSQFHNFHRLLKKQEPGFASFDFPPKKHIGNKDTKFVDERRRKLQEYLRKVVNHTLETNKILASHPDKILLISILPFFGEVTPPVKPKRSRSRGRNLFFRGSESAQQDLSRIPVGPGHGQYTGL